MDFKQLTEIQVSNSDKGKKNVRDKDRTANYPNMEGRLEVHQKLR